MDTSSYTILPYLVKAWNANEAGLLQAATGLLPQLVFTYNTQTNKLLFHNEQRLTAVLGYSHEDVIKWEDNLLNIVYHEDLVKATEELGKAYRLSGEAHHSFDCRLTHKTHTCRYATICAAVLSVDEQGKSQSLLFTAEDITKKVELEKKIALLEDQLYDTESLLEFGNWHWEIETGKLLWSGGMYRLLGYKPEDTPAALSIVDYTKHILAKDLAYFHDIVSAAIKNKSGFECRYMIETQQGEQKVVLTKGRPARLASGKLLMLSGITCDVTNLTKTNSDLVAYKEMNTEREFFLNQGSWETNLQTGETTWSRGMFRIFGYETENEVRNTKVTNTLHLTHLAEEDVEKHKADWLRILKDKSDYVREALIITLHGQHKQVETYGKIIRNNDGTPVKVIGTTKDVTSLQEYKKSLEEKINELNHRNTELEGFAYIASHDLQEPLRKLTAFSERLLHKYRPQLGDEGKMYLDRIVASTENMQVMIDNLLEFSRTARSSKHFSKASIYSLLQEAQSDLELKIEESGTVFHLSSFPEIEVIPSQIIRLFSNLISNSIKFKKEHQQPLITVACEKLGQPEKKSHGLKSGKEYYLLSVTDNGIGFEKEYAERIFQMFQRLHSKHEYPGSGIGLAICKKIVENHQGIIYAEAEVNQGATFTMILPENQLQ